MERLWKLALIATLVSAGSSAQTVTTSGGTTNTVPVYTSSSILGNAPITVSGSNVGIGTTNPQSALDVVGNINSSTTTAGLGMISFGSSSPYIYVGSLPNGGTGAVQHLEVEVLGGSWTSQGLTRWVCNAYGGAVRCTRINDSFSPNMNDMAVFLANNNSYDFYVSGNANNGWSSFAVSARVFDGTYYRMITPTNTSSPSGTQQNIALTVGPTLTQEGSVGIGTTAPNAKLEVNGSLLLTTGSGALMTYADGTTQSTAWTGVLSGGDYAESVDISGARDALEPGDLIVIDSEKNGKFLKSATPYSTFVGGVYATNPGVTGRRQPRNKSNEGEVPMAMVGIAPTKVSAENGPIRRGDLLVSSSTPGYAMKGTDRVKLTGAVVGKALENLDSDKGVIEVLISLQ